jgi:site-specific DNA-cytosine methylase
MSALTSVLPRAVRTGLTLIERLGFEVDALDCFCGYGGSSQGIHRAGVTVRAAANHKQIAIDTHAANFPDTEHWRADLVDPDSGDYVDPKDLPRARFAWFSPGCGDHSKANAKKLYEQGRQMTLGFDDDFDEVAFASSERSRVTMSCVLRYTANNRPEIVVVENVCEVTNWGPGGDGTTFQWWLREMNLLGYNVQPCWFNSMFFDTPQSRDRVYFVCSRVGNTLPDVDYRPPAVCNSDACQGARVEAVQTWKRRTRAWRLDRWGKYDTQYTYTCPTCRARVEPGTPAALDILDFTIPCPTIGERADLGLKPLVAASRARIGAGLQRHGWAPIITAGAGNVYETTPGNRARSLDEPLAVQSTTATHALATAPGFIYQPAHGGRSYPMGQPLRTVCASDDRPAIVLPLRNNARPWPVSGPVPTVAAGGNHHALIVRNNDDGRGRVGWATTSATEPLRTLTTSGHQSLLMPYYATGVARSTARPAPTVTTHDRCALITDAGLHPAPSYSEADLEALIDACGFRMLVADPEIRGAMGFEPDYILLGNKGQKVAGLGNAVTPNVAEWITQRCVATLQGVAA